MKFLTNRHQRLRGSRADAEVDDRIYLLKKVGRLRATYQVRLLAYRAQKERKILVIRVPSVFEAAPSLSALIQENPGLILIERT